MTAARRSPLYREGIPSARLNICVEHRPSGLALINKSDSRGNALKIHTDMLVLNYADNPYQSARGGGII